MRLIFAILMVCLALPSFSQPYNRKDLDKQTVDYPFIWGAQYYRAPTPDKEYWDSDMNASLNLVLPILSSGCNGAGHNLQMKNTISKIWMILLILLRSTICV